MKHQTIATLSLLLSAVAAMPTNLLRREVPQEHSHEQFLRTVNTFLKMDNPDNIVDAVFGLLGNAAASAGQGSITDTDCLQQATADRAFTNAKSAGSVDGMTAALVYRALERNTGSVGLASTACTSIKAVNPEIAAISQHQDPASQGAAATNKAITLELAKQIASVGGDPQVALKSGTFAPGQIGDPTAAGNSCDDPNDPVGCIFTQNLLVEDATAAEIDAAVAGVSSNSGSSSNAGAGVVTTTSTTTVTAGATAAAAAASSQVCSKAQGGTSSNTAAAAPASTTAAAASSSNSNLSFGTCTDPSIKFGVGFDGRTEASFEPNNKSQFNHGSAQNIAIIANFICQQLSNGNCGQPGANQAAVDACASGTAAAAQASGQAAADAFNSALGF